MLYNPEWKKEAKEVSLQDFIEWLETKNPNEAYDYQDKTGMCCLGQYMKDRNIPWSYLPVSEGGGTYKQVCIALFGDTDRKTSQSVLRCNIPNAMVSPRTFGKALACAKAYNKEKINA